MSAKYDPDNSALLVPPYTIVHLSSRDLASQLPINFVTRLGVSVTTACFGDGTYEEAFAQKCISNLLASTYRRLVLDLYWDFGLRQFSFCPVAIPLNSSDTPSPSSLTPVSSTASAANISSFVSRQTRSIIARRQVISPIPSGPQNSSTSSVVASPTQPPISTFTTASGQTLYELGSYQCTASINLQFFLSLVFDYVTNTSDTLQANLLFFDLNLHTAASPNDPNGPAQTPPGSSLPTQAELIGSAFENVMSTYIYTPTLLGIDRSNLNDSWYAVQASSQPNGGYFTIDVQQDGSFSTSDGWPCEVYLQVSKARRVLVGWSNIDPQMQGYNFIGDADTIFAAGLLSEPRLATSSSSGEVTEGCFFDPSKLRVSQVNSSWALSDVGQVADMPYFANNLTSCGISAILNTTLSGSTADADAAAYLAFAQSTDWSWAQGEPRNVSAASDDDNPNSLFRCAVMDISNAYVGKWRVEDCSKHFRSACRVDNQPYVWQLSSSTVPFSTGPDSCSPNASFAVPRTGLENTYLYEYVLSISQGLDTSSSGQSEIWLNFNSLDVEGCWVSTGPNGTCTYYASEEETRQRQVLVPTIGAIIVLILTGLTIFVKCNANRRKSRTRRRKGEGGWDYEGVPS